MGAYLVSATKGGGTCKHWRVVADFDGELVEEVVHEDSLDDQVTILKAAESDWRHIVLVSWLNAHAKKNNKFDKLVRRKIIDDSPSEEPWMTNK